MKHEGRVIQEGLKRGQSEEGPREGLCLCLRHTFHIILFPDIAEASPHFSLADLRLLLPPGQLPGLHNVTGLLPEVVLPQNFLPGKIQQSHDDQLSERYKN